jgi:hypothetical protein
MLLAISSFKAIVLPFTEIAAEQTWVAVSI